jgi:hypothetical protein
MAAGPHHLGDHRRHPPRHRWPHVMAEALGSPWRVIDEGHPGRTTVHDDPIEGAHKNGLRSLPVALESHRPVDLVILMLGTNDLKTRFALPPIDIARGVERLARWLTSPAGPDQKRAAAAAGLPGADCRGRRAWAHVRWAAPRRRSAAVLAGRGRRARWARVFRRGHGGRGRSGRRHPLFGRRRTRPRRGTCRRRPRRGWRRPRAERQNGRKDMLKGIDPRLNADVLYVLRAMGHGDVLVLADTNFPSDSSRGIPSTASFCGWTT